MRTLHSAGRTRVGAVASWTGLDRKNLKFAGAGAKALAGIILARNGY